MRMQEVTDLVNVPFTVQRMGRAKSCQHEVTRKNISLSFLRTEVKQHSPLHEHHHTHDQEDRPELIHDISRLLAETPVRKTA